MRLAKFILAIVAGIVIVAGAGLAYITVTFDKVRVRGEIERLVLAKTGRTLGLGADLSLSVFPDIAVEIGALTLSERGEPKREFAAVERARVAIRVLPLLSKQIEAKEIHLAGVRAHIVADRNGRRNVDDLIGESSGKVATDTAPPPRFAIAGLQVERATIDFLDQATGKRYELKDLVLRTGALANVSAGNLAAAGKLSAPEGSVEFDARGRYRLDIDTGAHGVDSLTLAVRGDTAAIKGFEAKIDAATLSMSRPGQFKVDKLVVNGKGRIGAESFELKLDLPALNSEAGRLSGGKIDLGARLTGTSRSIHVSANSEKLTGTADAARFDGLRLVIDSKQAERSLKGELAAKVGLSMASRRLTLADMAGDFSLSDPSLPTRQAKVGISGSARADWGRLTASGEMRIRLDESSASTKWEISRLTPMALVFDVGIDKLDVDRYRSPPVANAAGAAPVKGGGAESPLDLSVLQGIGARGKIRIGDLKASGLKLADLRADLNLSDGILAADSYSAALYDGTLAGKASVDSRGNRMQIRQTLVAVNISPLLRDVSRNDFLEGRGNVTLDLAAAGQSVGALKRSLAGSASFSLHDGAVKGIDLAKSFRELKAKLGARQDRVQKASQNEKTDFSELSASFKIANGIAHNDDLAGKSPFLRLSGKGKIDLVESSIDYLAGATVVNTSTGQAGKELEHLKGLTLPVRLSGPFDKLSWKIEYAALIEGVVKTEVQEKVQKKIEGKLGEKLKGLFGR